MLLGQPEGTGREQCLAGPAWFWFFDFGICKMVKKYYNLCEAITAIKGT